MRGVIVAKKPNLTEKFEFIGSVEEFFYSIFDELADFVYIVYIPWRQWKEVIIDDDAMEAINCSDKNRIYNLYNVFIQRRYESYHFTLTIYAIDTARSFSPILTLEQKEFIQSLLKEDAEDINLSRFLNSILYLDFRKYLEGNGVECFYKYDVYKHRRGRMRIFKRGLIPRSSIEQMNSLFDFTVEIFETIGPPPKID